MFRDSIKGKKLIQHYFNEKLDDTILSNNEHLEVLYQYMYQKDIKAEKSIHDMHYYIYSNEKCIDFIDQCKTAHEDFFSTKYDNMELNNQDEFNKHILSRLYNLNFLKNHRKPIRDLRNLLIAIGEYIDE